MKCAAFELPFTRRRAVRPARCAGGARRPRRAGAGAPRPDEHATISTTPAGRSGAWTWTSESYPADAVSLRSVSSDNFVVVDTTREPRVIGETDFTSGPSTLHPKAIYIVEGEAVSGGEARLRGPQGVRARDRLRLLHRRDHLHPGHHPRHVRGDRRRRTASSDAATRCDRASHGEVHVVSRVVGFKKIKFYTNENVGSGELDLPEQQMHTTSYWLTIPADGDGDAAVRRRRSPRRRRRAGVRDAAGRAAAADVRSARHRHLDRHRRAGRSGEPRCRRAPITARGCSSTTTIRAASASASRCSACTASCSSDARRLIAECDCENGCPGCVGPVGNTGPLAKIAALRILALLLDAPRGGAGRTSDESWQPDAIACAAIVRPAPARAGVDQRAGIRFGASRGRAVRSARAGARRRRGATHDASRVFRRRAQSSRPTPCTVARSGRRLADAARRRGGATRRCWRQGPPRARRSCSSISKPPV